MIPTLRLEGAESLDSALLELEGAVARRLVSKALIEALEPVVPAAKAKVPVDTGALQASVGIGTKLTRRQSRLRKRIAPAEAYVGPGIANKGGVRAVAHAHLVEFGTRKMPPRPYLRPAWDSKMPEVFQRLGGLLWAGIERIAKRARRGR